MKQINSERDMLLGRAAGGTRRGVEISPAHMRQVLHVFQRQFRFELPQELLPFAQNSVFGADGLPNPGGIRDIGGMPGAFDKIALTSPSKVSAVKSRGRAIAILARRLCRRCGRPLELIVCAPRSRAICCRRLTTGRRLRYASKKSV
eukprot:SAG31_NODE_11911_length_987_cov_0.825450_2_plen_147_part_00